MSRLSALLVIAALALVALGTYSVLRGSPADPTAAPASASSQLALATASTPLGQVVTGDGATLYRFDKDTAKPAKSNCAGACAKTWPPVLARSGQPELGGIDPALVGIVVRPDGSEQLTLGGWPLYRYAGDTIGQTKGEGVGGTWHAVGPTGKPAVKSGAGAAVQKSAEKSTAKSAGAPGWQAEKPAEKPAPAPAAPAPDTADDGGGYSGGY
ncbi:MAG TPA: hypothetical protein VGH99_08505 [Pseudonocardia sp.]|jgi:predicted lipoprotein with Yx(FWY)xxD motif